MDISFVILSWNSERYLGRCVDSIDHSLKNTDFLYEIHVLDNGSRDGTPNLLKRIAEERSGIIIPYFEPSNIGTTKSRNRLFAEALGKYICVMDSDTELRQGVMEALIMAIESDRRLGIAVPRILYPSGAWQKSFDRFPTLVDKFNRFIHLRSIEEQESIQFSGATQPFYVDYAISAFWLIRRELFSTVGLLDEQIFYSPEDVDFCLRVWKSGYRILYVPSVSIIHHTQEISRGLKINRAKLSHLKGLFYYFFKHRYFLHRPQFRIDAGKSEQSHVASS